MSEFKAGYFQKEAGGYFRCLLCPRECRIDDGNVGVCGVRKNINGEFLSEIYGKVSSVGIDPIEKKPLYHYYPGRTVFSVGTLGCNLKCPYCQNWSISQNPKGTFKAYEPKDLTKLAKDEGSFGIAYTYSEPVIWIEFVLAAAEYGASYGLKNILVTNGFAQEAPWKDLLKVTDAVNIDLKTFNPETFSRIHGGKLSVVLKNIETAYSAGCHIELTTLAVTGINDSEAELMSIANFIASIDKSIPWHISGYFPAWKYKAPATEAGFLFKIREEALSVLDFVYCGNIGAGSDTFCPSCKSMLIKRRGFSVRIKGLDIKERAAFCASCGRKINIAAD